MPKHELPDLGSIPSLARLDPASIPPSGLWVAPVLPPGRFIGYQDPAIVADIQAGQWLDGTAFEPFFADKTASASAVIELVPRIPKVIQRAMATYPLDKADRVGRGLPTLELQAAVLEIGGTALKTALAQPRQPNTTVIPLNSDHPYRGLKAGFHPDNQDRRPLAERALSRRRFIPNFGPGNRLAAVLLPDIVTAGRAVGFPETSTLEGQRAGYDIYSEYLQAYPDRVVCIAMPVKPGQGSLINTDFVFHDGMTIGAIAESLTAQILGDWTLGELALAP